MNIKEIGYFSKTHGVKGHLILKTEFELFIDEIKAFFIEASGGKAPYFVSEIRESNNGIIVLLETVDVIEKAKLLLRKKVFIDAAFVAEQEEEDDWVGFELIDAHFGSLGNILEVTDTGTQILVSIRYKEKEIILPLADDFIESIDQSAKKIKFKAPEGLIDLYLEI